MSMPTNWCNIGILYRVSSMSEWNRHSIVAGMGNRVRSYPPDASREPPDPSPAENVLASFSCASVTIPVPPQTSSAQTCPLSVSNPPTHPDRWGLCKAL